MESTDTTERWFIFPPPETAAVDLFCLPHSGGGATAYRGWLDAFGPAVAVRPLQLPGRESRLREAPEIDVRRIAEVISQGNRPFALYGHSFGALLAYEVTRELQRLGRPLPQRLFLGACRPPWLASAEAARLGALPDEEFVDALIALGGTTWDIRQEPALLAMIIRGLRSDFGWMARYDYQPDPVLPIPVVALAGAEDSLAPAGTMAGWSAVSTGEFTLHTVPGGHFFAQQQVALTTRTLLRDWPDASGGLE